MRPGGGRPHNSSACCCFGLCVWRRCSPLCSPPAHRRCPATRAVVALGPDDGATVPANPNGIQVRFTCPAYRQFGDDPAIEQRLGARPVLEHDEVERRDDDELLRRAVMGAERKQLPLAAEQETARLLRLARRRQGGSQEHGRHEVGT